MLLKMEYLSSVIGISPTTKYEISFWPPNGVFHCCPHDGWMQYSGARGSPSRDLVAAAFVLA
jgi:hypothetical protein